MGWNKPNGGKADSLLMGNSWHELAPSVASRLATPSHHIGLFAIASHEGGGIGTSVKLKVQCERV
jgi:hypothetical protein